MRNINLGGNRFKNKPIRGYALIDDEDFEEISRYKWSRSSSHGKFYAKTGNKPCIYMHTLILKTPKGMQTDHIDGNGLNNQRGNLRVCTIAENLRNRGKTKINTSGYKGVSFHKATKKYRARIIINYKEIHLGLFNEAKNASRAYKIASLKFHKEFSHS